MWILVAVNITKADLQRGLVKGPVVKRVLPRGTAESKPQLPPVRELRGLVLERKGLPPFYPQAPGDGWILPTNVAYTWHDEWTPTIVVDQYGVLWVALQDLQGYQDPDGVYWSTIDLYYSTDAGLSWVPAVSIYAYSYHNVAYDLGDPVLQYDPASASLVLTYDGLFYYYIAYWGWVASDYDVGVCRWDITGPGSLSGFTSGWLAYSGDNESVPALAVERGHSNNYAFVSFEVSDGSVRVYRVDPVTLSYSLVWSYYGVGGYAGQVWSNASDRVVQVTFKEGSDWDACYTACYAYSLNRGNSWTVVKRSFSNPVYQSTSAAAYGSDYAVWTIQVNPTSSDGDIRMLWSTNNGQTWAAEYWLENSVISLDSRMPMLIAEKSDLNNATSEFFYFGAYREVVSGSGEGNYWFLMAPVSNADEASDWTTPPGVDQFVIPSSLLPNYNIQEANWAQLHLVSFPYSGGYTPGVVWTHAYSSYDHDIHFSRPTQPLFMETAEGKASQELKLLTPVSRGELLFSVPPEMAGRELVLYRPDGSVAWRGPLQERVDIRALSAGAYLWRTGEVGGKLLVAR